MRAPARCPDGCLSFRVMPSSSSISARCPASRSMARPDGIECLVIAGLVSPTIVALLFPATLWHRRAPVFSVEVTASLSLWLPCPRAVCGGRVHIRGISIPIAVELPDMFLSVRLSLVPAWSHARDFETLRVRRVAMCADILYRQTSPSTMFK
jgi:hypothetical protein